MTKKIQVLIIGRFAILLLLTASWIWSNGDSNLFREYFLIFLVASILTVVYILILKISDKYLWQIRTQFFLDTFLITWLVWQTGDVTSPFLMLYVVLIGIVGVFLGGRGTLLYAGLCTFLFTFLSILTAFSHIRSYAAIPETAKFIQIVGLHNVTFLTIGILSARLVRRHNISEELKQKTETLANLRVLHQRIVESIRSGLITVDLDGKIHTFNRAAEEITGYPAEQMRGESVFELFDDLKKRLQGEVLNEKESHDRQKRNEIRITTPAGATVQIGYSISPLFVKSGETTGFIITFQDLTEIRLMEKNIRQKDRLAAVGRVAAGLAHEIRNPLGAMRGAIQILEKHVAKSPTQDNLMEIILCESDRLNNIITNFLKYARPKSGAFTSVNVNEAIKDTITLLQHSPEVKKHHAIKVDLPKESISISADVSQLKQIFWNLSRNAIQAMGNGGTLTISLQAMNGERINIMFSDTGCGMPSKQVERLFEPFSSSTTGGTGLGLPIVYQIVRDHGGTLNVASKENKGTDINIYLPTDCLNKKSRTISYAEKFGAKSSERGNDLDVGKAKKTLGAH